VFRLTPLVYARRRPPWVIEGLALWCSQGPAGDGATGCSALGAVHAVVVLIELSLLLVSDEPGAVAVVGINVFPAVAVAPVLLDDCLVGVFGWFVHTANIQKSPERFSRLMN